MSVSQPQVSTTEAASVQAQPATINPSQPTSEPQADKDKQETDGSPVVKYILIGVLTVALVLLMYYAYNRFVTNSISEPMTKGVEQERDDPVVDFNLREAIRDLQNIQKNVLGTLSETVNI